MISFFCINAPPKRELKTESMHENRTQTEIRGESRPSTRHSDPSSLAVQQSLHMERQSTAETAWKNVIISIQSMNQHRRYKDNLW